MARLSVETFLLLGMAAEPQFMSSLEMGSKRYRTPLRRTVSPSQKIARFTGPVPMAADVRRGPAAALVDGTSALSPP
jgi:hypothetical protein